MAERVLKEKTGFEMEGVWGQAITFVLVMFGWILFRSESFKYAFDFIGSMFGAGSGGALEYYSFSFDDFKGTQLNNFCILEDISETGYGTETVEPVTSKLNGVGIRSSSLLMQNKAKAPLGKLLIIGDSYSNYVISYNSGIADCFSEINYLNMNYGDFDNLIIDITKEQADYVLFESIETAMPSYNQKFEQLMSGLG